MGISGIFNKNNLPWADEGAFGRSGNNKIRALRELNNWSQEDMAERLKMAKSSYSRLERDESRLELAKLEKVR